MEVSDEDGSMGERGDLDQGLSQHKGSSLADKDAHQAIIHMHPLASPLSPLSTGKLLFVTCTHFSLGTLLVALANR